MSRKSWMILLLVIILLQIVLIAAQEQGVAVGTPLRVFAWPLYRGAVVIRDSFSNLVYRFRSQERLIEENLALEEKMNQLIMENTLLEETIQQLISELDARRIEREIPFEIIPAQVVARDPYDWMGRAIIDKGTEDGLRENLLVVTYEGLAGRVEEVHPRHAVIRLILSPSLAIGGIVQRTRDLGVVTGDGSGRCIMKYVYQTSPVTVGDLVVTSGLGVDTPRGVVIGKVEAVNTLGGSMFKEVLIEPSCDFSSLEKVFVIQSFSQEDEVHF